jgi:Rrf2 family protein
MSMRLSTKGRYALRAVIDLAEQEAQGLVSLKSIADRQELSLKYLEALFTRLCKKGVLKSSRGARGGYSLARSPKKIAVIDILAAIENGFDRFFCRQERHQCKRYAGCRTRPFWERLRNVITRELTGTTVADLMESKGHDDK